MFTLQTLPIEGPAYVFSGGDIKEQNHHHDNRAQKYGFDFVGVPDGAKRCRGDGSRNEDYYIYGRGILAPADGIVIEAVDGIRDNVPKQMNNYMIFGNYVILQHALAAHSVLAHLKCGSVACVPASV